MKISNSKKELARIISDNGGWRDGNYAVQDKDDKKVWFMRALAGRPDGASFWPGVKSRGIPYSKVLTNWHQTVLSRAEYLHLYPAPDADGWIEWKGGECPVGGDVIVACKVRTGKEFRNGKKIKASILRWRHTGGMADIIAYRLHKHEKYKPEFCESAMRSIPEPGINSKNINITQVDDINVVESKPTIEQLAADYRNAKDYAERKQQEADDAKADADEKLRVLEIAGEAIGLIVSPITAKQEPGLVITDWRDLKVGDVISVSGKWWEPDSEYTVDENDGSRDAPIRVGGYWALIGECSFKFICRP